jgi:hypothetical protein
VWWGQIHLEILFHSKHVVISRLIRILYFTLFIFQVQVRRAKSEITSKQITMVKKRIRDPEVLEEAPPAKSEADDSGSDDVCSLSLVTSNAY